MPTLLIRGPDGTLVERELVGRLTVGCDDDNDLVLRNGGVEKRHANFFADGGEVVLEQLDFSAAQTLVDGAPAPKRTRLKPGVRVLIGGYEVRVKPGEQQLSVRRVALAADTLPPDEAVAFPFKPVLACAALALVGLLAVGVWKRVAPATAVAVAVEKAPDACPELENDLRIARSAATQGALDAANRAVDCDPLNPEAMALKRSLRQELDGQALLSRAKELVELERDEQALEQLEKIPPGTEVARLALPLVREVAERSRRRARSDCDAYLKAGKKALAQPRCDEAARLAKLLEPSAAETPKGPSLGDRVHARLPEPALAEAVLLYAAGRNGEALVKLQALRERSDAAALHARADALRKDMSNADGLYKVGARALEKGELDRGAAALRDALALDAKVVPEGESAMKKTIEHDAAARAYELGVVQAQHQNWVKACALWKVGFSFSHGNTELNTAVTNDCTNRARTLGRSDACRDLDEALALAVPGDELEPVLKQKREALRCRP